MSAQDTGPPAAAPVVTNFTYNAYGQTKTRVDFAESTTSTRATTTFTYDPAGRLDIEDGPRTGVTDSLSYDYDLAGRLTSAKQDGITLPGGGTGVATSYLWDDASERVRVFQPLTSSLTHVRDWTYDQSGRMASFLENGTTTTYSYGPGNQLEQVGDPRGITLAFEYDNLGRQTRRYKAGPPVADDQTFSFDQSGNMLSANVVATSTAITMDYDQDGRLLKVYQASSSPTTTYAYNATTGRLSSIADPAGTTAFSLYDANGLLKEISDPFSNTKVIYTYDTAGRVTQRTDGGKLCLTQTYEANIGRVDTRTIKGGTNPCSGSIRASFNLDYDLASNVTKRVETLTGNTFAGTYNYTYDEANRLKTVAGPANFGSRTYDYDGGGNRTSVQVNPNPAVTTTYNAASLPVSSSDGTTYSHDQIGDLTAIDRSGSSNDWFFSYSSWNQLTKAARSPGSADVTYALDALDRVLSWASTGATSQYTYQGSGEVLAKSVVAGSTTTYAHTPGGPLAQKIGNTKRYYLQDLHRDLVGWSDTNGALQGTALYDPWGELLSGTGEMATAPTNGAFRFQSDLTDAATGQVDMGTRRYDPVLGRFSTRDTVFGDPTNPGTMNQYPYGGGNPVTMRDPTGMGACSMAGGCVTETEDGRRITRGGNPGDADYDRSVHGETSATSPGVVTPVPVAPGGISPWSRLKVLEYGWYRISIDARGGASWASASDSAFYFDLETGDLMVTFGDNEITLGDFSKIALVGGRLASNGAGISFLSNELTIGPDGKLSWSAFGVSSSSSLGRGSVMVTHEVTYGEAFPIAWRSTASYSGAVSGGRVRADLRITVEPTESFTKPVAIAAGSAFAYAALVHVAKVPFFLSTPASQSLAIAGKYR